MSTRLRQIATETEFEQLLATSSRPVLVDVTATWCGPCQRLTPILEEFAATQDTIAVVSLDTDALRPLARRLGGSGIPRLYLFDRGVLQLEAAGVKEPEWLDDMVGGYPALGITRPDGVPLPPRTAARSITLPQPAAGSAVLFTVDGEDGSRQGPVPVPCTVELPAGGYAQLSLTVEAIDSGYLDAVDPSWLDEVCVTEGGTLTAAHLEQVARLSSLRRLEGILTSVQTDDLLVLKDLTLLRTLRISLTPIPLPHGVFPHVTDGGSWLAPSLKDARLAAGLPEHPLHEIATSPVSVSGKLTRRDDGTLQLAVWLEISNGWYTYPPGSDEGLPVSMTLTSPHEVVQPLAAQSNDARLQGQATLVALLDGPDEARLEVTVLACDGSVCAPSATRLVVPLSTTR